MSQSASADPLLESLVADFGGNYVFALDLLEVYRADRRAVDKSWRDYFDRATGIPVPDEDEGPLAQLVSESQPVRADVPVTPSPAPAPAASGSTAVMRVGSAPPAARKDIKYREILTGMERTIKENRVERYIGNIREARDYLVAIQRRRNHRGP